MICVATVVARGYRLVKKNQYISRTANVYRDSEKRSRQHNRTEKAAKGSRHEGVSQNPKPKI
eukprot:5188552-Amphidinium_carterae.1